MLFILHTVPVAFSADSKLIRNLLLLPETLDIQVVTRESESGKSTLKMVRDIVSKVWRQSWFGCAFLIVPPARLTHMSTTKWAWLVLMILLDACASCGWIWSRSFHPRIVCSRNSSSKSLMLILERLMIAEACTSVPSISWRADKTSDVKLPFRWASLKSAYWSRSARHCCLSKGCSKSEQHSGTSRSIGAADLSL